MNKIIFQNQILMLVFLFTSGFSKAQTRVLLSSGRVNSCQYVVFEPSKQIKSTTVGTPESVEGFMASILQADNQAKVNAYTLGGARNAEQKTAKDFEQIRNRNKEKTYFELISQFEISSSGQSFVLIKFKIHLEQAPNGISGVYQLQKVGNRWYKTSRSDLSEIALMLVFMKADILKSILDNQTNKEPLLIDLRAKVQDKEGINFKKLYKEFTSWEKDKTKSDYFLEPTGW